MKIKLQIAGPLLVLLCGLFALQPVDAIAADRVPRTSVKLLTIGNSFADNSTRFLSGISRAGGKDLLIFRANLGGHSLQQHVKYLQDFEASSDGSQGRAYKGDTDPPTGKKGEMSLREILLMQPWDIVTIQQVSHLSPLVESYHPDAGVLIDYIRRYAPQAQILIHETWAYPEDCPRYGDPKYPHLKNPQVMYQNIQAAYGKLSAETGLKIIPVGAAFQAELSAPNPIRLHRKADIHANASGEYLGGAVFYEMLFQDSVESNSFVPPDVSPEDAKVLRRIAHETVAKATKE